jgi:hypothetical protein
MKRTFALLTGAAIALGWLAIVPDANAHERYFDPYGHYYGGSPYNYYYGGPYNYYYGATIIIGGGRLVGAPCMLRTDPRRGDTTIQASETSKTGHAVRAAVLQHWAA